MSFLLPAAFAALAALLLPLLVHLNRSSERKPTWFAALRWLSETARPRRRIRFEELLLLALRLLLVAAVVTLQAQPVLTTPPGPRDWVVVAPGVERSAARAALAGAAVGSQWRWLAPGFPSFDLPAPAGPAPTSSLLRELDAGLAADAKLTVLVTELVGGLDGELAELGRDVQWRVVAGAPPVADAPRATVNRLVALRTTDGNEAGVRYLRAAIAGWNAGFASGDDAATAAGRYDIDAANAEQALPARADWLAWLVAGELPAKVRTWVAAGGVALVGADTRLPELEGGAVLWRDARGAVLARGVALGSGRVVRIERALAPATLPALLEPDFPRALHALFAPEPPAPARASADAARPVHSAGKDATRGALAGVRGLEQGDERVELIQSALALLLALLFATERVLASRAARWRRAA